MKPELKTVCIPLDIMDKESRPTKDVIIGYSFNNYKPKKVSHWLKKQELITFTPEEYNQHIQQVIKDTLNIAANKSEAETYTIKWDDSVYAKVDKQSIINTFEETFNKLKL